MKTASFILYYSQIVVAIWCLVALIWNTLVGNFAIALIDSVLFLVNIMVTAITEEYKEPRQHMYKFIDKYLK